MNRIFKRSARIFVRLSSPMPRNDPKVSSCFISLPSSSIDLAEKTLKQIERNEHYASLLLTLCDRSTTPDDIRRASVITFKNFIRRNWPSLDNSNVISLQDRNHIKEHIVELMTRSPEHIQEQLSEAITVIGQCDFPEQWPNLLETMIRQFQQQQSSNSFQSINGVLKTAHSLFERYRHEQKSEELWTEIKLVLDNFAPAFTQLFQVSSDVLFSKRDLQVRFPIVFDDVLSNERSRSSGIEEYLRCIAVDDEDLLRSDRSGITGTLRRSSDRIHDAFPDTSLLRQC